MNKEQTEKSIELADAHWNYYVSKILFAHNIPIEVINICGFHYKSAFVHGFKHGIEHWISEDQMIESMDK